MGQRVMLRQSSALQHTMHQLVLTIDVQMEVQSSAPRSAAREPNIDGTGQRSRQASAKQ